MIRVVKVIFILVFFNLSMCNYAIAGACSGSWGKDIKLADNLKTILVEEIPVPIKSSDFSEAEVFKNMMISYEKKSG